MTRYERYNGSFPNDIIVIQLWRINAFETNTSGRISDYGMYLQNSIMLNDHSTLRKIDDMGTIERLRDLDQYDIARRSCTGLIVLIFYVATDELWLYSLAGTAALCHFDRA